MANIAEQEINSAEEDPNIAQMELKATVVWMTSAEQCFDSQETGICFVMPLDHDVTDYTSEFEDLASNINTVNHGAVEELLCQVEGKEKSESCQKLVVVHLSQT